MSLQHLLHSPEPIMREVGDYLRLANRVRNAWERVEWAEANGRDSTRARAFHARIAHERLWANADLHQSVMSEFGFDPDEATEWICQQIAGTK